MLKILLVEDEVHNRTILKEILEKLHCEVWAAGDGYEALNLLGRHDFHLILSDIRMPNLSGIELFNHFQLIYQKQTHKIKPKFIFMTAYGQIDEAVQLMRQGADHFLTKPIRKKELQQIIDSLKNQYQKKHQAYSKIYGDFLERVNTVAATDSSVLILGESGTGKELVAQLIHKNSRRKNQPFIGFNSAAIPHDLVESELFGYEKGAFSGANVAKPGLLLSAHGGSFYFDDLETMPYAAQTKILRVIQERSFYSLGSVLAKTVDLRWIASSQYSLFSKIENDLFRKDLYYRFSVVTLEVPALRNRSSDISLLANEFLAELVLRENKGGLTIADAAMNELLNYSWPGNVRELKNVIERAVVLSEGNQIQPADLQLAHSRLEPAHTLTFSLGSSLKSVEDQLFAQTLTMCNGDKVKAAQILGVNLRTIYRWLDRNKESSLNF